MRFSQLKDLPKVQRLLARGYVISISDNDSDSAWCEVTRPADLNVYHEVSMRLVKALLQYVKTPMPNLGRKLRTMFLEEPGCVPRMCLLCESNFKARSYEVASSYAETRLFMARLMNLNLIPFNLKELS